MSAHWLTCIKTGEVTHLGLSLVALMMWYTNLVEKTMQLANAAINLLRQVASIHLDDGRK